jgi:hypothetical protein
MATLSVPYTILGTGLMKNFRVGKPNSVIWGMGGWRKWHSIWGMSQAGPYIARSTIYDVCMNYLCAAKSAKIAMHLYLLVYHIIIKLQLLVPNLIFRTRHSGRDPSLGMWISGCYTAYLALYDTYGGPVRLQRNDLKWNFIETIAELR